MLSYSCLLSFVVVDCRDVGDKESDEGRRAIGNDQQTTQQWRSAPFSCLFLNIGQSLAGSLKRKKQ